MQNCHQGVPPEVADSAIGSHPSLPSYRPRLRAGIENVRGVKPGGPVTRAVAVDKEPSGWYDFGLPWLKLTQE